MGVVTEKPVFDESKARPGFGTLYFNVISVTTYTIGGRPKEEEIVLRVQYACKTDDPAVGMPEKAIVAFSGYLRKGRRGLYIEAAKRIYAMGGLYAAAQELAPGISPDGLIEEDDCGPGRIG